MARPTEASYAVQLDALRGLAVASVLVHHYLPARWSSLRLGALGVKLFFVLSGYLITEKLLDCRGYMAQGQSLGTTVKRFYARRTLRIFPLYYLALTITALVGLGQARSLVPWTFSYATNFYITLSGDWPGAFSPYWTLAVEEQFYLVWPWFILLTPGPWLWRGCLLAVTSAPIFRTLAIAGGFAPDLVGVLPVSCLDTLGLGAATAIAGHASTSRPWFHANLRRWAWGAVLLALGLQFARSPFAYFAAFDLAYGFAMAALVLSAAHGIGGHSGRLLENELLVRLGKISYGVYALHAFAAYLVQPALERSALALGTLAGLLLLGLAWVGLNGGSTGLRSLLTLAAASLLVSTAAIVAARESLIAPGIRDIWVYFALCWLVSVVLASLSFALFEEPINNYKRYFPYRERPLTRP